MILGMPTTVVNKRNSSYDVYIGRPSKWGNPFSDKFSKYTTMRTSTRANAIQKYEEWIRTQPQLLSAIKSELKGKVLGCWCSPLPCHGDILARLADSK
jgi:hypothetical protein